jgi:signal peptidase I
VPPVASDGLALTATRDETALPEAASPAGARAGIWKALLELLHDLAVAVLFCFFLITFVAQAFRVQGTSMLPLLEDGERIIVNKLVYRIRPIERGDVVVFWYPRDPSVSFIKRVVGLPDDVVEIKAGLVYVNGKRIEEGYLASRYRDDESYSPVQIKKGYYYVLGDHRNSSNDSRSWGEVPEKYIYGRAIFRFWPLAKAGVIQ